MTLPIIMHTTFLAAKHGIFTHGLESYTPTKTDTIYNWRSVRSFVTYGAPPYNSAALDLLKIFLILAHTYSSGPNNSVVLNKHSGWTISAKLINVWSGISMWSFKSKY